jgi:glycosyltransferase involved in cell wall biosynthesis
MGEIGYPAKNDFLGNAAAVLFPINWPEPFGLVMIEAMACGTPVIAYPGGSVNEIMQDGVTGFVVRDARSAADALQRLDEIDRQKCREYFENRFSVERMASDYVAIYERLVKREPASLTLTDGVFDWMKLESPSSTT